LFAVRYAENPPNHFAVVLRTALEMPHERDVHRHRSITRVLVTRSELDMVEIKARYKEVSENALDADIKTAFTGHFQDACLNLIIGNA